MAGGKGGSTTSTVAIPEYIEAAAQRNLNKAERISRVGYTPYYGPDVAAFTPMQQAGFQNIADTAGAFGMAAPTAQQDIMGGMGPATTYEGGVQGYSSAPIYEQALQTLGERRPGQKAYIDSFFIDPYSGGAAGDFAPIDYTQYGTMADQAAAQRANDLAIAQAGAGDYTSTDFAGNEVPYTVVDATDTRPAGYVSNPPGPFTEQRQYTDSSPMTDGGPAIMYNSDGTITDLGYDLGPSVAGGRGTIVPGQPTGGEQASAYITNPAAGITDTSAAGTGTQVLNDLTEFGTGLASNTLAGSILLGPSYNVGGVNNPIETPAIAEMQASAPPGMTYNPSTGSYVAAPVVTTPVQSNNNSSNNTATSSAPVTSIRPISRNDASGGADTGGGFDADGGLFSKVGDFFGGIGDALGVTDYSGAGGGLLSSSNTPSPTAAPSPAPAPTTFEGPIPTGTTLPTGSTVVNTYDGGFESRPAHSTDNDREFDAFYDTKIKDPVSGKTLTPFQLNNRINSPNLGKAYADAGITSIDQILKPAPVAAQPSPLPADTSTSAGMEVRALPNGTEYFVDASGNFAGLK